MPRPNLARLLCEAAGMLRNISCCFPPLIKEYADLPHAMKKALTS
jgi:hypothetical protein